MKRITLITLIALVILTTSCNSPIKRAAVEAKYTPILILNDSIQAINFKTGKDGTKEYTTLTIKFKLEGVDRTAVTLNYKNAYAIPADRIAHDKQIGYFILAKDIK